MRDGSSEAYTGYAAASARANQRRRWAFFSSLVVHDAEGQTPTVWLDDPAKEAVCEETTDEVVLIKVQRNVVNHTLPRQRQ